MDVRLWLSLPRGVRLMAKMLFWDVRAGIRTVASAEDVLEGLLLGVSSERWETPHQKGYSPEEKEKIKAFYLAWFNHVA